MKDLETTYELDKNWKPKYVYIVEKDNQSDEFNSHYDMMMAVRDWEGVEDLIYARELELDSKFPADCDEDRDMWILEIIDEVLDEAGYTVHHVLR